MSSKSNGTKNRYDYKNMNKWDLIDSLSIIPEHPIIQERRIVSAIAKIFEEVNNSNEKLSNRLVWLNIVIAIATIAGVFVAIFIK